MTQRVSLRPSVATDFVALELAPPPCRIRGITAVRGDEVLGIGGIAYLPNGVHAAFVHARPEAAAYRVTFHKAGLAAIALARELGIRRLVAQADESIPRAGAWLKRLGFTEPSGNDGVWLWQR